MYTLLFRINTTLVVDSEVIRNHSIPIQASLSWPSLVEQSVRFPPTHVGNHTEQELTLTNLADVPVLVQVLPLMIYPHPNGAMDLVSDRFVTWPLCLLHSFLLGLLLGYKNVGH